jgi:hypothetical protein
MMVTYGATGGGLVSGDAVAIIGMACQVLGAGSPVALWRLLCDGVDAVTQVPSDRWNAQGVAIEDLPERERAAIRHGGFLDHVDSLGFGGTTTTRDEDTTTPHGPSSTGDGAGTLCPTTGW